ncbi:hypothetical protein K443DRAFT_9423 [Laccaria amethystina LaAM-08-1]|uniref:UBA domain-containing protein n=1 Tax=Laccaria amethystina LaAM-08-1 TaxID=1095629 RepID=A0A0C9X9I7_9AGAR|nr:hypothetical protein K443DRAFT_9423 [Laccaria amethystina LaAM-08-1]
MAQMFQGAGIGGGTGMFGAPPTPFPAPGNPNANSATPSTTTSPTTTSPAANPFGMFGGAGGAGGNPFGADPALMQQFLTGGGFGGAGGFGGYSAPGAGGFGGAPAVSTDTRPPEERFQVQLLELQDMGFTNAAQNLRVLLATEGRVNYVVMNKPSDNEVLIIGRTMRRVE